MPEDVQSITSTIATTVDVQDFHTHVQLDKDGTIEREDVFLYTEQEFVEQELIGTHTDKDV